MSILLIRHGETAANAARVVQLPDEPLNERGRGQARKVAGRITHDEIPVTRILSSDLARARATAEAIGAVTGVAVETDPLLQERNFGDLRGHAYADLGLDPMVEGYHPPAGESWEQFRERSDRAFDRVASAAREVEGDGCLVVVTHGLVCHCFAARHLSLDPETPAPLRWGNTSWTAIDRQPPWRVSVLNCTRHLEGAFADSAAAASGL